MSAIEAGLKQMISELAAMPSRDRHGVIALLSDAETRKLAPLIEETTASAHSEEFLELLRELESDRLPSGITPAAAAAIRAAAASSPPVRLDVPPRRSARLAGVVSLVLGGRTR